MENIEKLNRGFVQFTGKIVNGQIFTPDKENSYFTDIEILMKENDGKIEISQVYENNDIEDIAIIINPQTKYLHLKNIAIKNFKYIGKNLNSMIINCIVSDNTIK